MDVPTAHSGMEIIPRKECLRLLSGQRVGRLGFVVDGQPMVLPVNYVLRGDVVVFRTGEGSKLDGALLAKVAFEVDDVDVVTGDGWSVLVQGVAEEVTEDERSIDESLRDVVIPIWLTTPADHYVRIIPHMISGRRLPRPLAS